VELEVEMQAEMRSKPSIKTNFRQGKIFSRRERR
jgi:hypothetical protein